MARHFNKLGGAPYRTGGSKDVRNNIIDEADLANALATHFNEKERHRTGLPRPPPTR